MRDPEFAEKAGRVLDLYQRLFEGRRLRPDEYVICADEKSQLQALGRRHETLPQCSGSSGPVRVRVPPRRHARLPGRLGCPPRQPVRPCRGEDRDRAVRPPGRAGDDAPSPTPQRAPSTGSWTTAPRTPARPRSNECRRSWENARLIHLPDPRLLAEPDRAVFLDSPAQGADPQQLPLPSELAERLLAFAEHYRQIARPFEWTFTRGNLDALLARIDRHEPQLALAA